MLESIVADLRYAVRALSRRPVLTVVILATLALGIGATTAVFSVVHATLFRPAPFSEPDRLAMLYLTRTAGSTENLRWSYPRFDLMRRSARSFESVAAFTSADVNLTSRAEPERVQVEVVSAGYLPVLRVAPVLGRNFLPEEDAASPARVAVLVSHGLWRRRFRESAEVVGATIGVNSTPVVVVGVLPQGFSGLSGRADLWIPSAAAPRLTYSDYLTTNQNFINAVARLANGVTIDQAGAEMKALGRQIDQAFPSTSAVPAAWSATAVPIDSVRIDPANRRSLLVLLGAVGLVLTIGCVNIASLLVGRAAVRGREMALRLALGAGRPRLIRQLLTESLGLAVLGGALGALVAAWGSAVLGSFAPGRVPNPANDYAQLGEFAAVSVDLPVLLFAAALSIVTGVACGLAPALHASRTDLSAALQQGAYGTRSASRWGGLSLVVVAQIALALVVLAGAGLLLRSFARLQGENIGFEPTRVLTFWVNPPDSRYRTEQGPEVVERLLERVTAVPGVASASVSRCAPFTSRCARAAVYFAGEPLPAPGAAPIVGRHYVGPDHFRTLGIPLLAGRGFTSGDRAGHPPVVVVNRTAARRFWPGENPIGKRVWFSSGSAFNSPERSAEIVGVVGDVRYWPVEQPPGPDFYTCYLQFTYPSALLFVRGERDPLALMTALRQAVRTVDPDLPIYDVKTLEQIGGDALARPRFNASLAGAFAGAALLLAAIGIYGVLASWVADRTREIGIRIALGADSRSVLRLALGRSLKLSIVGAAVGLAVALAATRMLGSMLHGIDTADLGTFAAVVAVTLFAALLASLVPALRAARVDPIAALRAE